MLDELDIIPDITFIIIDTLFMWKASDLKLDHGSTSGVAPTKRPGMVLTEGGGTEAAKCVVKVGTKTGGEIRLLSEGATHLADMDVILDAIGFLYYLAVTGTFHVAGKVI